MRREEGGGGDERADSFRCSFKMRVIFLFGVQPGIIEKGWVRAPFKVLVGDGESLLQIQLDHLLSSIHHPKEDGCSLS